MKQEVCLLTKTRSAVYVFYNKLRHLCRKYNILLKYLTQLTYNGDIHKCGSMANKFLRDQMSADLYHKLESPGCLPRDNKRIESLLYSYGQRYDGFNLLRQIILPHCPNLQNGARPIQPTWNSCEDNLYVLQVLLETYYSAEQTMGRSYPPAQQSINFLNKAMKSPRYSALAKIAKKQVVDRGVDTAPPRRLCLAKLATTLNLDNALDDITLDPNCPPIVHRVNTRAMSNMQKSTTSTTLTNRGRDDTRQRPNSYQPLSSIPNDPALKFKPARTSEQCKVCKRWGHHSNSCFLMCQVYWCQEFIKKYPRFIEAIAL